MSFEERLKGALEYLHSSKIKDRQEGLSDIKELFAQESSVTRYHSSQIKKRKGEHIWAPIFNALETCIRSEKTAAASAKKSADTAEKRLAVAAGIYRWLLERAVALVPKKVIVSIWEFLHKGMRRRGELHPAVALDFIKALECIASDKSHLPRLEDEKDEQKWLDVVELAFNIVLGRSLNIQLMNSSSPDDSAMYGEDSLALESYEDLHPSLGNKRKRKPLDSQPDPSQPRPFLGPISAEQVAAMSLLSVLLKSNSAPILRIQDCSAAILHCLRLFLHLYHTDSSLHHDFLESMLSTLRHMSLNRRDEVIEFARASWDPLLDLWGTKNKILKEGLVSILRLLFPYFTASDLDATVTAGLAKMWHLMSGGVEIKWAVAPLSLDMIRLEIVHESVSDLPENHEAFKAKTFRAGPQFDAGQALTWAILELQADCAEKLFLHFESKPPSSQPTQSNRSSRLSENPLTSLLRSIRLATFMMLRIYDLQILLFFIDRHWRVVHESLQSEIIRTLLEYVSSDDGVVQSWSFLCLAAVAYADCSENVNTVSTSTPFAASLSQMSASSILPRSVSTWDSVWTHAIRRASSSQVCRAACHTASVLLVYASSNPAKRSLIRSPLTSHRVLAEIETLAKDLDVQGPSGPYDSVCMFLSLCLRVANQDVRLYRMQLEEKVLAWLVESWKPAHIDSSENSFYSASDVMQLLETICAFTHHSSLICRVVLPHSLTTETLVAEGQTKVIRDYLLNARLPSVKKDNSSHHAPSQEALDSGNTSFAAPISSEGGLVEPRGRERKISTFLLRCLESLTQALPSNGTLPRADAAKKALDVAVISLCFESVLGLNGIQTNRRVVQAACKLISSIILLLERPQWTMEEKDIILRVLEPLVCIDPGSYDDSPWTALLPPTKGTGIRTQTLKSLLSDEKRQQNSLREKRIGHLKELWSSADVQSTFNDVLATLRNVFRIVVGIPISTDVMAVDDSFGASRANTQSLVDLSRTTVQALALYRVASTCISFLAAGPLLQQTSGKTRRDKELTQLMLDCAEIDMDQFLLVCPPFIDNVRNGTLKLLPDELKAFLDFFIERLDSYTTMRGEDLNLRLISFLDATLPLWVSLEEVNKDVREDFRDLARYLASSLRGGRFGFWKIRDSVVRLFDKYLTLDPSQHLWMDSNSKDDSPMGGLLLLIQDVDIRIRFRLAVVNARLFEITEDPMGLYDKMRRLYSVDITKVEHILTRVLSLGNIMVVSSTVRRGPYWHLVETCFHSDLFTRHIESILIGVAQRLGLKRLPELFEAYAYQLAYSIRQAGQNVLSLPVSLIGYKDLKERAMRTIRHFAPANLLAIGNNQSRDHGRSLFQGHCHAILQAPEKVIRECFGDIVGYQVVAFLDDPENPVDQLEQSILNTLDSNDLPAFQETLITTVDSVAATILRTLSSQDFTENGRIVQTLRTTDESGESVKLFSTLTKYRRMDDIDTHLPNLPNFSPETVLAALRWLVEEIPGANNHALTYHVLQELFAAVQRAFLVNEQLRLVNAISLWIAYRHAVTSFDDATLLHALIRGACSLLGQWDLAPAAQSMLEWCFSLYTGKDPRFPDILIRVACVCHDYATDADDSIAKTRSDALVTWVDNQTYSLSKNSNVAEQVKLALPAWPHEPSEKLRPLFETIHPASLSKILSDKYVSSNKFRLIRRLRDQAQHQIYDKVQFAQTDFWKLKECMPPAHQLRAEDVHAFASLLVLNQGSISSFGSDPEQRFLLNSSSKTRQHKEQIINKFHSPGNALILVLLMMLEDHDDDGSRYAAYQTLRSLMLTLTPESFELLSQLSPTEYRIEVSYLREFPPTPSLRDVPDLPTCLLSEEFIDAAQDFPMWISLITTLLADALSASSSFFAQLCGILSSHIVFADKVLPFLVQTLLQSSNGESHSSALSRYFSQLLCSADTAVPCRRSIIDVVLHLRHIERDGDALAYNRWLDISFLSLAQNAITCRAYTTALLFLELNAEYKDPSINDDVSTEQIMYEIYSNIDEPDGFYAIRTQDHHQFLMRRFHHEKEWEKAFRFHGAALETDTSNAKEFDGLLQSFHSYGFNHIATKTLLDSDQDANSTMAYQLGWRAETWDLPECPDSRYPGASLYLALRAVHRERDQGVTNAVIQHVLYREMDHLRALGSENIAQIREAIQTLMCLSQATEWRSSSIQNLITGKATDVQNWLTFTTVQDGFQFDDIESIMATRISLIKSARRKEQRQQIGDMLSPFGQTLLEVEKQCLLRLSEAAREANQVQVALNSVIHAKNLERFSSMAVTEEFASVLWAYKEEKHAVEYLKDLRRDAQSSEPIWLAQVIARLGTWTAEACLEQPSFIEHEFFTQALSMIDEHAHGREDRATVYHRYAKFAESQYKTALDSPDLIRLNVYRERKEKELNYYQQMAKGRTTSDTVLSNQMNTVKKVLAQDNKAMADLIANRDASLKQAIKMYSRCLEASDSFDEDVPIRLCSLWLSNFDLDVIQEDLREALKVVPSRKLVFLAHQIFSRIDDSNTEAQQTLLPTIIRMCSEHPFHSLYQLFCLQPPKSNAAKVDRRSSGRVHGGKESEQPTGRALAAQKVFKHLLNNPSTRDRTAAVQELCDAMLTFANFPVKQAQDKKVPDSQPIRNLRLSRQKVPVITAYTPIDPSSRYDPSECVCVDEYARQFDTAGGVNLPKIINCMGSDGRKYKQLFKGDQKDDLRQDAVMEQVFDLVNIVLRRDGETKRRNLYIRGYKVIPLASQAGILEFVGNTTTLKSWLDKAHPKYRPNDMKGIGKRLMEHQKKKNPSDENHKFYLECMKKFKPVMRHYFTETHKTPIAWFRNRLNYTRSVATTSIVGHILGLGDRHTSNILLDNSKGEVIHIDLGVAFDQGKLLPVPENVPFRMTPDMVDGMGISGTNGVFQRCAEETLRVLRDGSDVIMTVLQVFRYDPLYNWTMSDYKMKKQVEDGSSTTTTTMMKNPENEKILSERLGIGINLDSTRAQEDADRALMGVSGKLSRNLSVAAAVRTLVAEATSTYNLGTIYCGWGPHY